jgi:DNA repair protein RecN (Recombination protein N)
MRKHSVASVEELLQVRDSLEQELLGAERSIEDRNALVERIKELEAERNSLAEELSRAREAKIKGLGKTLQDSIRDLQMPYAVFEVALEDAGKYTMQGKDAVQFLFSANGNGKLNPVQKAASGGELSRIMLCLKALMANFTGMPTMIFDEIDTGVSGSIAHKMGELIGKMGERMQIIAITHLPQIASKRGTHLLVQKEFDRHNNAATRIRRIEGDERVKEVARMLSGSELTNAALENARELLKENDIK